MEKKSSMKKTLKVRQSKRKTLSVSVNDINDESIPKKKKNTRNTRKIDDNQIATSIEPCNTISVKGNKRNLKFSPGSNNTFTSESHSDVPKTSSDCNTTKLEENVAVNKKGKLHNLKSVQGDTIKECTGKKAKKGNKNFSLLPSVYIEPISLDNNVMQKYKSSVNISNCQTIKEKSDVIDKFKTETTQNSPKCLKTKLKIAKKRKYHGLVTDTISQNMKRKMHVKRAILRQKIESQVLSNQRTELNNDIKTSENEKRSEKLNLSSSSSEVSPQTLRSIYTSPPAQVVNTDSTSKLSMVLMHKHIPVKPFNISINIDNRNRGRKVEFVNPINCTTNTTFVQNNLVKTTSDENLSDITSLSDVTNALPVLQYYCGWLYDFSEEENMFNITSTDSIFSHSKLVSLNDDELALNNYQTKWETQVECASQNSSQTTSSTQSNFTFIKPILPPVKRPPTRIKLNKCSTPNTLITNSPDSLSVTDKTSSTGQNSTSNAAVSHDEDAISLFSGWSINSSDFNSSNNNNSVQIKNNEDTKKKSPEVAPPIVKVANRIDLRNLPRTSPFKAIEEWVENTQQQLQLQDRKSFHDMNAIPQVFRVFCYYAFTSGVCTKKNCSRIHRLGRNHKIYLENLNVTQLMEAYDYAKSRVGLFLPFINNFTLEFAKFNCSNELIAMVGDVMIPENTRKFWDVRNIISALQKTGYTLAKSVEEILFAHGRNNLELSNVLLSTVFEEIKDLGGNWNLVQKLCEYRSSPINNNLIEHLLKMCYELHNSDLSVKTVEDLFKSNLVDLNVLDKTVFTNFVTFLQYNNLTVQINILSELARLNNITINIDTNSTRLNQQTQSTNSLQNNLNYFQPFFENPYVDNLRSTVDTMKFSPPPPSVHNGNATNQIYNSVEQCTSDINIQDTLLQQAYPNNIPSIIENTNHDRNDLHVNLEQAELDLCEDSSSSECISVSIVEDDGNDVKAHNNNSTENFEAFYNSANKEFERLEICLSDNEVKKLSEIISQKRHEDLITLYNTYKNTAYNHSFLLNVLGLFKKQGTTTIYELLNNLIEGLERENSHFAYLNNAETTLYTLALNTIVLLKQMRGFKEAATILFKFFDCLDNLVKVQWLRSMHKHSLSEVGKYLYFCQIFTRGGYFTATLEILKSEDLNLLHSFNKWSLPYTESFDNDYRNDVVQEFIRITLREDLTVAKNIILYMVTSKDSITEVNYWKYFDDLILAILNNNITTHLTEMLPNILQGWYKHVNKNNMRGLVVQLVTAKISEKQLITLYSKCCKENIYKKLKGNETSIILRTDMTTEEIFLTIRYFLYKLTKNSFEIQEVTFVIELPNELKNKPKVLLNSESEIVETKDRILIVLTKCFPTAIIIQNCHEYNIRVKPDQLKLCVDYYRKEICDSKSFWVRQSAVEQLGAM